MDIRDVALWLAFALICAVPALLISRRTRIRIAAFLACVAAAFMLPVLAGLVGISGNTLVVLALLCPVPITVAPPLNLAAASF